MRLSRFKLENFRNLAACDLALPAAEVYVLYGQNGAGKTNLLEALSLLSPGRGIHGDSPDDMLAHGADEWSFFVSGEVQGQPHSLGQLYRDGKRSLQVDGTKAESYADLAVTGSVVWLTPKQDRLFFETPKIRRQFLDRLVYGVTPAHADWLSRYQRDLKTRQKLLKDHRPDLDWLDLLEEQLATVGTQINAARQAYLEQLNAMLNSEGLQLSLESGLEKAPDAAAFQFALRQDRERDARFTATHTGPHRADLKGVYPARQLQLALASMGQHKKALIHILLAHTKVVHQATGVAPTLLLDEVTAHLDAEVRQELLSQLRALHAPLWLAGTERSLFEDVPNACFIKVENGRVMPEAQDA
jgi:DNA replication and repair protein RecF